MVTAALARGTLTDAVLVTSEACQHRAAVCRRGPEVTLLTSLPQALCLVSLGVLQLSSTATLFPMCEFLVVCPVPDIQAALSGQPHLLLVSAIVFKGVSDWVGKELKEVHLKKTLTNPYFYKCGTLLSYAFVWRGVYFGGGYQCEGWREARGVPWDAGRDAGVCFQPPLPWFPDAISATNPRVIDDSRARKLSNDLKRCTYYETCATYGLNVERVFQDGNRSGRRVSGPGGQQRCPNT